MHELSLAESMVREIESYLDREKAEKVYKVVIHIGRFAGVEKAPFEFAYPIVAEGTRLEGSELEIEILPAIVTCAECGSDTVLDIPLIKCGKCGSRNVKYKQGKEFLIKSMEIE